MLKGFSVPLTPQGKSSLATMPPWHYSSDCIAIEYWTDPAAIATLLPPGLTPDEKSGRPRVFLVSRLAVHRFQRRIDRPCPLSIPRGLCPGRGGLRRHAGQLLPLHLRRQRRRDRARLGAGFPEEARQRLSDAQLLCAERRRGAPCQGKPLRRERRSAWRTAGDRANPARGKDRRSLDGVQSPDHDAPLLPATRGRPVKPSRRSTS